MITGRTAGDKSGQQIAQRLFEIEQAALVEQHGHGCGGDDLGHAGQVVDGLGGNGGRAGFIGEVAQRVLEQDSSPARTPKAQPGKARAAIASLRPGRRLRKPARSALEPASDFAMHG